MSFLAAALSWLFGSGLKVFTVPLLAVGLLVAVHQAVKTHNEKIALAATALCDAKWEADIRQQERDAAEKRERATLAILESERRTSEELRDELEGVRSEADALRAATDSVDSKCLSDSVLDALRKKR